MNVEFVDKLPAGTNAVNRGRELKAFLEALKGRPGQWAKWPYPITSRAAGAQVVSRINSGMVAAFRGVNLEATRSDTDVFVRYVGDVQ